MVSAGLGWFGLAWAGLEWFGLVWAGLGRGGTDRRARPGTEGELEHEGEREEARTNGARAGQNDVQGTGARRENLDWGEGVGRGPGDFETDDNRKRTKQALSAASQHTYNKLH